MSNNNSQTTKQLFSLLDTPDLPSLGPQPRKSRLALSALQESLDKYLKAGSLDAGSQSLICSMVLLWHDYLDESHSISQEIHNASGSFVHGIMHRREPDYWNSKYWFNRAGAHPTFPVIATKVGEHLHKAGDSALNSKLLPQGNWDPFAFVDACEQVAKKPAGRTYELLQQIQQIESQVLLEHFIAAP